MTTRATRYTQSFLIRLLSAALLTVATAQGAFAGVVYRWVDVNVNPITGPIQGELVVDPAVWEIGGGVTETYSGGVGPKPIPGIQSFRFKGVNLGWSIDYDTNNLGAFDTFSFDIVFGAVLTGSRMFFNEQFDTVDLNPAAGPLWQVNYFGTDSGGPCQSNPDVCRGGTGIWALDLSTIPVPEPTSLSLCGSALALSLLAAARARSQRKAPAPR